MKLPSSNTKLNAFTVLELTVVLALMSTIITIISVSLNRFGEQLKNNSDLHTELNDWFAFRSNLWNELSAADSVTYRKEEVYIFREGKEIRYRAADEMLERKTDKEWIPTGMEIENIEQEMKDGTGAITFNFLWKNEVMQLSYQQIPRAKEIIDHYFEESEDE